MLDSIILRPATEASYDFMRLLDHAAAITLRPATDCAFHRAVIGRKGEARRQVGAYLDTQLKWADSGSTPASLKIEP